MYKMVPNSCGKASRFAITTGLREGYGPDAKLHISDEVIDLVEAYLRKCAAAGRSYLTGSVTTGTVVYAWPEGDGWAGSDHEPQVTYSGNINPLYNSGISHEDITEFLNGLASSLGEALGQIRVYVEFDGVLWILQREDSETPTGETL